MGKKKILYFGHPVNVYGTDLQKKLLGIIAQRFLHWDIENPDQPHHEEGYQRYKRDKGNGMAYYFEKVLPKCSGGVFLPFRDGAWGRGVFGEAKCITENGFPIWTISHEGIVQAADVSIVRVLTVEETRARIRAADGILPY